MANFSLIVPAALQDTSSLDSYLILIWLSSICGFIFLVLTVTGLWKTFKKAGEPGWPAIIPILNWYYLVKISGHPGWWVLLFFVPILNIVIWVMVALDLAYAFRKTTFYGILIFFLPWLMFLMLGFGDAEYGGPNPV